MKITQILNRQHIGFMFKKHWRIQGKRVPINTKLEERLQKQNIPVIDALEFIKEKPEEHEPVKVIGQYEEPLPLDTNHPNYKERPCYALKHTSVLLEGISQAQVITKTIIAENKLPSKIEELAELEIPNMIHDGVKKAILSANIFDCEQKKLPKIKDPVRPAYNFPRILGITDRRRNIILTNKLAQLAEKSCDLETSLSKYIVNDVEIRSTFEKDGDLLQFQEVSNILVTSEKPLKHDVSGSNIEFKQIPDLYPIKHTITMFPQHFYEENSSYPIKKTASKLHPHTTWLHFNKTEVQNLYEEPVTHTQQLGRSLTHAFTVASSYAKELYGDNVKDLPEPIFVNCIQTDGQVFHFGVFELRTLDMNSSTEGTKNIWYTKNDLKLYESSKYFSAMPTLDKYNPKVYGYISAMYNC